MHTPTRVLWVTFDFPPRMSSGVYRPIKIYKYLDRGSCQVDFVTHGASRRFAGATYDDSLLREVTPAPRVVRVATPIPHDVLPALVNRLRRRRRGAESQRKGGSPGPIDGAAQAAEMSSRQGLATAMSDSAPPAPRPTESGSAYKRLAMAAYFPDHLMLWGVLAAVRCLWLQLRYGYDVVYTTSYPESAHLPGMVLKALGVPWVVDYRYGGPMWIKKLAGFTKTPARDARDLAYQRRVLRRADCVVTQSEQLRAGFCRTFGLEAANVHVVPSGFDESDFAGAESRPAPFAKQPGEIHLVHLGVMEGVQPADRRALVEALARLGDGLAARGRRLVIHAIGSDVLDGERNRDAIRFDYRLHGVVVHSALPPYLFAADCFLISTITTASGTDGITGFIPGKLWEYLRARRPVLMTGPKDAVWSVLEHQQAGLDLGDAAGAPSLPDRLLEAMASVPQADADVHQYSWESRAASLQQIFTSLHRSRVVAPEGAPIG